ncbi:MAG TPA: enoyl-ACP reductase FabV [Clostridia bacterium]
MVIKPKCRGFICTTAHPKGCAENVMEQVEFVSGKSKVNGPKNVLVVGASTGYGLASRIVSSFSSGAKTIGVFFEKPSSANSTATAGWYNTVAFEELAHKRGCYAKSINGDAYSNEIKQSTIELIKKDLGSIDLVVYSLASPRRTDPFTKVTYNSAIKPVGEPFTNKTINFHTGEVSTVTIEPASEEEIKDTVSVMGGEDWYLWMEELKKAGVLSKGAKTIAFSYIGPELTHAIYTQGTMGKAKEHLQNTVSKIDSLLGDIEGKSYVSVNKALVTQASSAIPVIPLYVSILFKVMKEKNVHEGCIEQIYRLFADRLYNEPVALDDQGRIRVDELEMQKDVQDEVAELWKAVNSDNVFELTDIEGYKKEFFKLFGFGFDNISYDEDVDHTVAIPSLRAE